MPYTNASTQTAIAGLANHVAIVPPALIQVPTDTTTPPEDIPTKHMEGPTIVPNPTDRLQPDVKAKKRPPLVTRLSLPHSEIEEPRSPPPTEAILSPLPAANTLHAGHTPIFPRSLSPLQPKEPSETHTPEEVEEVLTGPLTLPTEPTDGAADRIELQVLDAELEKIAHEQDNEIEDNTMPVEQVTSSIPTVSRDSKGRRRSSTDDLEVFDGVKLKKPRMNMGAPLGQV